MPTPAPPRALASIHDGSPTSDGNGVPLRRLAPWSGARGSEAFRALDPFLLLDHFGPMTLPPGTDVGFPPHPHKGFQTLTYLIQGAFRHRDSTGGRGTLLPGGAQLMTAGAGIVHEEMPVPEHLETGGPIEGVQLWINLPRALKGGKPGYEDIPAERMPWRDFPGGRLRNLAGHWLGEQGPVETPAQIAYAHVELEAGNHFEHPLPQGWTALVVPLHGSLSFPEGILRAGQVGFLENSSGGLGTSAPEPVSFLVLAGEALGEPIAHYGPFVMNTAAEIEEAIREYQEGRWGRLD
ncbi:MAG: pirin family protein [Acidobacteria bacterium]|nr:pirin family protein [Acidobacteriota bacterium]